MNFPPLFSYRFSMSVEEAAELARRAIYGATFRDAASGGCVSGMFQYALLCLFLFYLLCHHS
jgi:hypothetical protein